MFASVVTSAVLFIVAAEGQSMVERPRHPDAAAPYHVETLVLPNPIVAQGTHAASVELDDAPSPATQALSTVLAGVGAGVGGALFPMTMIGGGALGAHAFLAAGAAFPGQIPGGNLSAAVGLVVPAIGLSFCGGLAGLGATWALTYLGALPSGKDTAMRAASRAVAGACTGCVVGGVGVCLYTAATSRTADESTRFNSLPFPGGIVFLSSMTALTAAAAATLGDELDPTKPSVPSHVAMVTRASMRF